MRIKIILISHRPLVIGFNYQHQIQAIIYKFLQLSDPDFSFWLHQQGFVYKNDKRFKLFVFSGITFDSSVHINKSYKPNGYTFKATNRDSFTFSFQIASPVDKFIQHLIDGIFKEGGKILFKSMRPFMTNSMKRSCLHITFYLLMANLRKGSQSLKKEKMVYAMKFILKELCDRFKSLAR